MRNRGFTVIEGMIVIVIIGILAAIAIPNFISMRGRVQEREAAKAIAAATINHPDPQVRKSAAQLEEINRDAGYLYETPDACVTLKSNTRRYPGSSLATIQVVRVSDRRILEVIIPPDFIPMAGDTLQVKFIQYWSFNGNIIIVPTLVED